MASSREIGSELSSWFLCAVGAMTALGHTDELYGGCSCKERLRSLNKDTCPNLQLILKGFLSRLKSKLVLQQPPRSKTLSSASRSTNYKINDTLNVQRTPERTNLERAEREQLGRLLEEERTSRLELEKNMMAKFAELSQQMGTQQVPMKRVDNKENSNPNLQNILLQRSSPNKTPGSRPTTISSNALIQAAARHSRMFKAMDPKN